MKRGHGTPFGPSWLRSEGTYGRGKMFWPHVPGPCSPRRSTWRPSVRPFGLRRAHPRSPVPRRDRAHGGGSDAVRPALCCCPVPTPGPGGLRARTHARTRGLITRAPWPPKGQATEWTLAAAALTFRTEQWGGSSSSSTTCGQQDMRIVRSIASQACACVRAWAGVCPAGPAMPLGDVRRRGLDGWRHERRQGYRRSELGCPWERQARQTALSFCRLPSAHPLPLPFRLYHAKPNPRTRKKKTRKRRGGKGKRKTRERERSLSFVRCLPDQNWYPLVASSYFFSTTEKSCQYRRISDQGLTGKRRASRPWGARRRQRNVAQASVPAGHWGTTLSVPPVVSHSLLVSELCLCNTTNLCGVESIFPEAIFCDGRTASRGRTR